MMIIKIFASHC